jgi:hypothetical protein
MVTPIKRITRLGLALATRGAVCEAAEAAQRGDGASAKELCANAVNSAREWASDAAPYRRTQVMTLVGAVGTPSFRMSPNMQSTARGITGFSIVVRALLDAHELMADALTKRQAS